MEGSALRARAKLEAMTRDATGASRILSCEVVQSLWSGYGQILRFELQGGSCSSVVVKHVKWPTERDHPRAWNSDLGHERKVQSYVVETAWYRDHAGSCGTACRVPRCLALAASLAR